MKKRVIVIACFVFFAAFFLLQTVLAENQSIQKKVYYFYGEGCPHCEGVFRSGVLEKIKKIENTELYKLEVYFNQTNREFYLGFTESLDIPKTKRGVPLIVIEFCGEGYSYFIGEKPIIDNLVEAVTTCKPMKKISTGASSDDPNAEKVTLGGIVLAAIIDSFNPCAFGVLIFLMATLLSIGSSKRALKYGILYCFIVFLVYFFVGLGIIKIIMSYADILHYFVIVSSILVLIAGLIEIKDFFWYGRWFSLKIPNSIKPKIEKITRGGTIPAVIILGILVSLVELPCTGGIYLAILSLMSVNKTFGISYLLLYNLIFILPLLVIVFLIYFGTKTEKISGWVEGKKRWMRLIAGILMVLLSLYLINSVFHFFSFG